MAKSLTQINRLIPVSEKWKHLKILKPKTAWKPISGPAQSTMKSQELNEGLSQFSLRPPKPNAAQNAVDRSSLINGQERFSADQKPRHGTRMAALGR
jgi:hypothetical protein